MENNKEEVTAVYTLPQSPAVRLPAEELSREMVNSLVCGVKNSK